MPGLDRVQLGSGWSAWQDIALRSAGFPADDVTALNSPELAEHPDDEQVYQQATRELSAAVSRAAATPRLREAISWQNPKLIPHCLDKLGPGRPRLAHDREHEATLASYVQRYSLKNDTIGFTGPVCWARFTEDGDGLVVRPGERFLARRTVYFECWAIDEVARALSADPLLRPWLVPRRAAANLVEGATVHLVGQPALTLTERDAEVLSLVDGRRTVTAVAQELGWSEFPELGTPAALLPVLDELAARDLIRVDLVGPIEKWPERTLRDKLTGIPDQAAREHGLALLAPVLAARERVTEAAGDDVALQAAVAGLADRFRALTGVSDERRPGEMYAGRALVYLDSVRDLRVDFGPTLRAELAGPMCLLLDSARWLVAEIGAHYEQLCDELYDRRVAQQGSDTVDLASIIGLLTPHTFFHRAGLAKPVQLAVEEFQRRWASILRVAPDAGPVRLASADIAEQVRALFPPRPLPWATAVYHSPDFMLAARDSDAVRDGDFLLVLGELHVSFNSMESRVFVAQHEDEPAMLAAVEDVLGDRRIYAVHDKNSAGVTSRTTPPSALLSPGYTYWSIKGESADTPGPVVPGADLTVRREGGRLVVRSGCGTVEAPLSQVLGEHLSAASMNAFKLIGRDGYRPRVTIDKLVVARESWQFRAEDVAWARSKTERARFAGARAWRAQHGLPERMFYSTPVEDKPIFVDFRSLVFVNILAKVIRRTAQRGAGSVSLTEMLPDHSQLWLHDREGNRYTSEFRFLAVDEHELASELGR